MIDINNIVELSKSVVVETESEGTTAYGIWKVAKDVFESLGLDFTTSTGRDVTSQVFYNYSASGRINGVKGSKGTKYSDEEVENFVARLVAKARVS